VVKQNPAANKQRKNAAIRWKRLSPHGLASAVTWPFTEVEEEEEKLIQPVRLKNFNIKIIEIHPKDTSHEIHPKDIVWIFVWIVYVRTNH